MVECEGPGSGALFIPSIRSNGIGFMCEVMYKQNKRHIVNILLLSILAIAGLAVLVTVIINNAGNQNNFYGLQWLLIGALLLIVSIVAIVNKTRSYYKNRIEFEKTLPDHFIADWAIDKKGWAEFVRYKFEVDKNDATGLALITAVVFSVASVFVFLGELKVGFVILFTLVMTALGYLLGKFFGRFIAERKFERLVEVKDPQLYFTESSIIYNSQLILLNELGCKLLSFSIRSNSEIKTFSVMVECGLGQRKSTRKYMLPIPKDKTEEAQTLVQHYNKFLVVKS